MSRAPNYYIVEASVLPEIFRKVVETRRLLDTGEAETVNQAVRLTGISRSAFYKYKDAVRPFRDIKRDSVITMSILTRDKPGALSSVLTIFAANGANILTINQSIPNGGVGIVTISFIAEDPAASLDSFNAQIEALPDVIRTEVLAG